MRRLALAFVALGTLAVPAAPVSARPLPPPPVTAVRPIWAKIVITDTIVDYNTGATTGPRPVLLGDASTLYDCLQSLSGWDVVVTCTLDAGAGWAPLCSTVEAHALSGFVAGGWVSGAAACSDGSTAERVQTGNSIHGGPRPDGERASKSFTPMLAQQLVCVAAGTGSRGPTADYTVTCTYT